MSHDECSLHFPNDSTRKEPMDPEPARITTKSWVTAAALGLPIYLSSSLAKLTAHLYSKFHCGHSDSVEPRPLPRSLDRTSITTRMTLLLYYLLICNGLFYNMPAFCSVRGFRAENFICASCLRTEAY